MTEGDGEELYFELDAAETTGAIRLLLMAAEQPTVQEASPQPEERREETGERCLGAGGLSFSEAPFQQK